LIFNKLRLFFKNIFFIRNVFVYLHHRNKQNNNKMEELTIEFQDREIDVIGTFEPATKEWHEEVNEYQYLSAAFWIDCIKYKGKDITNLISKDNKEYITEDCLTELSGHYE